jgi:hypothetical protein|tara:strand:+ start:1258 stop:1680 length:423 start_codon:yes stop_codon:yes gene_type:complete
MSKKGEVMKLIRILSLVFLIMGCQGVIGSKDNETIDHVEWSIGTMEDPAGYSYSNENLKVTGMITNTGDTTILAPWSVEAEFYSDSTFTLILGGDQQPFDVNLQKGVSIQWTLEFTSNDIAESNYPNFAILNFRAFIRKN